MKRRWAPCRLGEKYQKDADKPVASVLFSVRLGCARTRVAVRVERRVGQACEGVSGSVRVGTGLL